MPPVRTGAVLPARQFFYHARFGDGLYTGCIATRTYVVLNITWWFTAPHPAASARRTQPYLFGPERRYPPHTHYTGLVQAGPPERQDISPHPHHHHPHLPPHPRRGGVGLDVPPPPPRYSNSYAYWTRWTDVDGISSDFSSSVGPLSSSSTMRDLFDAASYRNSGTLKDNDVNFTLYWFEHTDYVCRWFAATRLPYLFWLYRSTTFRLLAYTTFTCYRCYRDADTRSAG